MGVNSIQDSVCPRRAHVQLKTELRAGGSERRHSTAPVLRTKCARPIRRAPIRCGLEVDKLRRVRDSDSNCRGVDGHVNTSFRSDFFGGSVMVCVRFWELVALALNSTMGRLGRLVDVLAVVLVLTTGAYAMDGELGAFSVSAPAAVEDQRRVQRPAPTRSGANQDVSGNFRSFARSGCFLQPLK